MSCIKCFLQLMRREMYLFFKSFASRLIDILVVFCSSVIVFGYLMSDSGLKSSYGPFIIVGAIASFGLFETTWRASILAQDITDNKLTNYLILPIPSCYVFFSIALSWAVNTAILSFCLFPIGKLILWSEFSFSNVSIFKFVLIYIVGNLFYGFFALWISSLVTNLRNTSWLWSRIVNPLFMFCGYYYTWKSIYSLSSLVGAFHLLNPLLYILEGTKAAVLGQEGYLPFWLCFFTLCLFIIFFAFDAIRRFKKRLDYV